MDRRGVTAAGGNAVGTQTEVPHRRGEVSAERSPGVARGIRRLAIPIILGWLGLIGVLTVFVPPLDVVGELRAVSLSPKESPSVIALMRSGKVFEESDSDNAVMIVLEGQRPLDTTDRQYYDE